MMNCEKYRFAVAAEPDFDGGATHIADCDECRNYRAGMVRLNAQIARALAIDVPAVRMPELEDVDSSKVSALSKRRMTPPIWFALAASIVVAALLGFRWLGSGLGEPSLADEVLTHIQTEPTSFANTDHPLSAAQVAAVVPASVADMHDDGGIITYAHSCVIHGHTVPHLVIQGKHGPVTILLMPDEKVEKAESIRGNGLRGVILPVGNGSVAIVGDRDEELGSIEKSVTDSVKWST